MEEIIDYYQVGSREDIVVSSSSFKYIDPTRGGSPQAFLDFMDNGGGVDTKSTRIGTLVHKWHENRDNFKIAEVIKPSEKLGQIADKVIDLIKQGGNGSPEDYEQAIREIEYYKNRWDKGMSKLIDDVMASCDEYVTEYLLAKENNQIFLTATEVEPVRNACQAIENHPVARNLLFYQENGIDNIKAFTEVEVYWTEIRTIKINGEEKLVNVKCKAKIDKLVIDFERNIVKIIDLKTTGQGAYYYNETNFKTYKTYQQLSFYIVAATEFYNQYMKTKMFPENWNFEAYIVAVETNKLQQCVVYKINKEWIIQGARELNRLLNRIAWHQETKKWSYSIEEERNDYILNIPYVEDIKV